MHVLQASLQLHDELDPPHASIVIELDGQMVGGRDVVTADEWLAAVDALAVGANVDLRTALRGLLAQTVARLEGMVAQGRQRLDEREQSLLDWSAATEAVAAGTTDPPPAVR